ncbi:MULTISPECIES: hypothetical protein [unclassified Rathayibacter]|uniref:hypothetical protein n=1 Tax=unclassified Rathayibacter TaxID=2609250 RepID=UPI0006FDC5B2|nr:MULTISPECIES: hypothetical protein [unclassified Rathayibacter]KQQ06158.1 hypothetical protein ASF42_06480 [Rathayibacter sp. Leaf294]KQS14015.1 hypothetical protein ASG06_06490 [Rathayibacter sp. Leaf185]
MTSASVRPLSRWRTVLGAAVLVLASAVLQALAAVERWVVAADGWTREDRTIEDHLFDYAFPADPWENVGAAAQLHGIGTILLALGVLAAGRALTPPGRVGGLLVILIAASFGLLGLHALVSGVIDAPSPLQNVGIQLVLGLVSAVALVALALLWATVSWAAAVAAVLLLGATLPGYLFAAFAIAPMVMGYQSYDTTPWTEGVVAASTAVAGLLLLVAAGGRAVR